MKTYDEQKYLVSIDVQVTFDGMPSFYDSIKGLNAGHARYLAGKNWPSARIEIVAGIKNSL